MADKETGAYAGNGDSIDESIWDSPVKPTQKSKEQSSKLAHNSKPSHKDQEARDQALRQELASVRKVNESIEGVIGNLNKARKNIGTVNQTVGAASSLLNMWTRILSQTEHNQRLILDPNWQGATQDVTDMEAEVVAKQQAAMRKEAEEQERKQSAARKAEEDETRRTLTTTTQQKTSLRVRGRNTSRGASNTHSGYVGDTSTSTTNPSRGSSSTRRTTSGIGRGRGGRGRA